MKPIIKNAYKTEHFTSLDNCSLASIFHPLEEKLCFDSFSLSHAVIAPYSQNKPHLLKSSTEVFYILSGKGIFHAGKEEFAIGKGSAISIPPGCVQYIENTSGRDLEFLCIVTKPWREEDEAEA